VIVEKRFAMAVSTSLRGRVPGQAVISDIVVAQLDVPERSRLARIFGASPLASTTRSLYRAALGELAVGQMLNQLGPLWDILHVVPVDDLNGQIDHLIIGPPGVFALFTENYPGQEIKVAGESMSIGGRSVDDIPTVRRLSDSAAERLSNAAGRTINVEPVIILIDPTKLVLRERPAGVHIVTSKQLLRLLTRAERSLAGSEVAYISDVADRETTWESTFTPPERALQLSRDFAVLRERVRDAAQIRVAWGLIGFVVVCGLAWVGAVTVTEYLLGQ
jgi:hypothetical protein